MRNKTTTYKWAYLPFVFSSAAILATQAIAGPSGSQRYQDAKQVNSINQEYVGGNHSIGVGVDDDGNVDVEGNFGISRGEGHRTGVGLWAAYDLEGDDKGILGRGGQVNHAWVSKNASGQVTHVNKAFAAYDRSEAGHEKATVGYGQENENLFWDGRVSKGLSGGKNKRLVTNGTEIRTVTDRAYDWGVGATVGKFLPNANARIRAGIDHEWSGKVGKGEKDARNTTLSAGIEKFFQGTGHSLSLDVAGSKNSGGQRIDDDTDFSGRLGYKYDFGGASIYQPDRRYRRVRVEVPGQAVAPRYVQQQQYKKIPTFKNIPTYKTVPVYGNKQVRVPTRQLVKSTMELEGQTFFKLNSSKLIPSAKTRLKQIAAQIRRTGYKGSIRITGNTCGLGNARYDQILSEKRANEVRNFLIKNGFNPNHLIARGLGKGHPKYPRTPDQDFKNRRVDIEYVSQQQVAKTGYRTENKRVQTGTRQVQTGTRRVATGFKNVPAGAKNVMISNGRPGAPRVIWKTEAIPTSPAWIQRALNNNIRHDRSVNTYTTTYGNDGSIDNIVRAADDKAETDQGQPVTINVLSNDDPDATITRIVKDPANGTAVISGGQVIYTPNPNFTGTDVFTYEVKDPSGNITTADVQVIVKAVNVAPVAVNDAVKTECGSPVTLNVLGNDTDANGDELTITEFTQPANGTVTSGGANGSLIYTPNPGAACGIDDSFTYTISDGKGGTSTATVSVDIDPATPATNTAPVAVDDSTITDQGQSVKLNTLANDTDPDGDTLTIESIGTVANGTAMISGNQIMYTPNPSFVGTETFTYTISDGRGGTATATETVVVRDNTPVNAAPVATNDAQTVECSGTASINVLGNDTDANGDALTIASFTQPANGTVTRGANGQLVYTSNGSNCGMNDTFTYTIVDPDGLKSTATVTITLNEAPNKDPVAVDDSTTTGQGQSVKLNTLANDSDPDGNTLTIKSIGTVAHGTAMISGNQIMYTPNADFVGTETFTYTISDGKGGTATATETVVVTPKPNEAPNAKNDSVSTGCSAITIDALANDTDPDGDSLSLVSVDSGSLLYGTATQSGNKIIYQPSNTCGKGNIGVDNFSYTIRDSKGNTNSASVKVTLKGVTDGGNSQANADDALINAGEKVTLDVLANDSGKGLRIIRVDNPANGHAVVKNNKIVYTPDAGFTGTDTFYYDIIDVNGYNDSSMIIIDVISGCVKHSKCY